MNSTVLKQPHTVFVLDRCFQHLECIRTRAQEALLRSLPVDNLPDILHICGLPIQILNAISISYSPRVKDTYLEIIRVLPHINSKDRHLALPNHRVLVFSSLNGESLLVAYLNLYQPPPATALDTQQRRLERIVELLLVAPCRFDLLDELWCCGGLCLSRARGREVLPEQGVIDVASCVEFDGRLDRDLACDVGGVNCLGLGLQGCVEVGDILR